MKILFWIVGAVVVSMMGCTPGSDKCDRTSSVGLSQFPTRPFRAW